MKLYYACLLVVNLGMMEASLSDVYANVSDAGVSDTAFFDEVVNNLKDILTGNKSIDEKIKNVKLVVNQSFDISKISKKAIAQIERNYKVTSTEFKNIQPAILNYLCRKYVNLTRDYSNSNNVMVKKTGSKWSSYSHQIDYSITDERRRGKILKIAVCTINGKITDIIFNNVSLIDPAGFARKFDGDMKKFIEWLNNGTKK